VAVVGLLLTRGLCSRSKVSIPPSDKYFACGKTKSAGDYLYTNDQWFVVCWLVVSTWLRCAGALLHETKKNRNRKPQELTGLPAVVFPENGFYRTAG
jgi:hypothetical protein